MGNFKIGDKVRFKKISEKEFKEINNKKYNYFNSNYNNYLNFYNRFSNQILEIDIIDNNIIYCREYWFFKEDLEKVDYLKTKFKIVKELLKNE